MNAQIHAVKNSGAKTLPVSFDFSHLGLSIIMFPVKIPFKGIGIAHVQREC